MGAIVNAFLDEATLRLVKNEQFTEETQRLISTLRKMSAEFKEPMTVADAGRRGGSKTSATHDRTFYEGIGHKGGQRVKELIEKGKKAGGLIT